MAETLEGSLDRPLEGGVVPWSSGRHDMPHGPLPSISPTEGSNKSLTDILEISNLAASLKLAQPSGSSAMFLSLGRFLSPEVSNILINLKAALLYGDVETSSAVAGHILS